MKTLVPPPPRTLFSEYQLVKWLHDFDQQLRSWTLIGNKNIVVWYPWCTVKPNLHGFKMKVIKRLTHSKKERKRKCRLYVWLNVDSVERGRRVQPPGENLRSLPFSFARHVYSQLLMIKQLAFSCQWWDGSGTWTGVSPENDVIKNHQLGRCVCVRSFVSVIE